ncbi:MAG TPA: hypothetical protein VIF09_00120 [Polyangiaceae bacterium]|jgi:hypothetical protein
MGIALVTSDPGTFGFFAFGDQARGIVAIGSAPVGVLAIGTAARGVIAVGILAVGIIAIGGLALGASTWGVGVLGGGKVRGIGAGIGLDVGVVGFDPELVGGLPPEGQRRGWWARVLVLSLLVAGAVGVAWSVMPTDAKDLSSD